MNENDPWAERIETRPDEVLIALSLVEDLTTATTDHDRLMLSEYVLGGKSPVDPMLKLGAAQDVVSAHKRLETYLCDVIGRLKDEASR